MTVWALGPNLMGPGCPNACDTISFMPIQEATSLERDLRGTLGEDVRFDAGVKALYATDASNYRHIPLAVAVPRDAGSVLKTIAVCRAHKVPFLSRGAGTSLAGQTCNTAVVLDFSRHMNRILGIDVANRLATVQPGVILDHLRMEAEKYDLTFGPDPATHSRCTLGGMIGNNSCGVHSILAGKTVDNVQTLDIATYDGLRLTVGPTPPEMLEAKIRAGGREGAIYAALRGMRDRYETLIRHRFPKLPRRVSGYNLDELLPENNFNVARALVGTEGTCVTVLQAGLRLVPWPKHRQLLVIGYADVFQAADAAPGIRAMGPIGLEGMDVDMVMPLKRYRGYKEKIARLPKGNAWLLAEFGADTAAEAIEKAQAAAAAARAPMPTATLLCTDQEDEEAAWTLRESALAATAFIPGERDRLEGWEDTAVPPEKLGAYLRELRALYDKFHYKGAFYGHFGDGCLHTRIDFDIKTEQGRKDTRRFLDEAADLVVRYGGSLSGEHGDGQARAELLPKMYGPELVQAFREFKHVWDPTNKMNPGKIVEPRGILDDLRMPPPPASDTHFSYSDDVGGFSRAVARCVGVGKCRKEEGGLMCPSYQATRDEMHSTRGRAHLLDEMLRAETIKDGWKSEEVKEALDLCLSCKGCKSECPTNIDMATYKAEFLAHYYEGRRRPRQAYAFGLIEHWAKLGSIAPGLTNFFTQTPPFSAIAKWLSGMAPERKIPRFAKQTFQQWFKRRVDSPPVTAGNDGRDGSSSASVFPSSSPTASGGGSILLWPDTFTNHFNPEIGQASVAVLEHYGYRVIVPDTPICCGRPLYDFGFLKQAKCQLQAILNLLKPDLEAGLPLIVLEPSCASVFRDEAVNFFPKDALAQRLKNQTVLLSEFLLNEDVTFPAASSSALLQTHCHQKSVLTASADREVLKRLGVTTSEPESGCCGMAGAFGFEPDHVALSKTLGERALLPAIRQADATMAIVADGFSCREQISQGAGRKAVHLAEVLKNALSPADVTKA